MTRVKRGTISAKTRRNTLKLVKGYRFGRGSKERQANEAIAHAGTYAFAHRRDKKGDFRRMWQVQIGAKLKEAGTSYSKFIGLLKKNNIEVDRKIMAEVAQSNPESFDRFLKKVQAM